MHTFPIAQSFNCFEPGFDQGVGMESLDPTEGDAVVIAFQLVNTSGPSVDMIQIQIPYDNFTEDTLLSLEADPEAFSAMVMHLDLQSLFNPTVTSGRILALLMDGEFYVDEVADPCAGAGCPTATGTMWLEFAMIKADLDPSVFE